MFTTVGAACLTTGVKPMEISAWEPGTRVSAQPGVLRQIARTTRARSMKPPSIPRPKDMRRQGTKCNRKEKDPCRFGRGLEKKPLGFNVLFFVCGHFCGFDAGAVSGAFGIDIAIDEFDDGHWGHVTIAEAGLENADVAA